jgi:hypothetical protein
MLTTIMQYAFMPNNLIYLGLDFMITELYMNSFLAMLNARKSIRRRAENSSRGVTSSTGGVPSTRGPGPISITVTQDKFRVRECRFRGICGGMLTSSEQDIDVIPLHDRAAPEMPVGVDSKGYARYKMPTTHFGDAV